MVQRQLDILHALTLAVTRALDVDEILAAALDALPRIAPHDVAAAHLIDADGRRLVLRCQRGMSPALEDVSRALVRGEGVIGGVAENGKAVVHDRVVDAIDVHPAARPVLARERLHAVLCVPVAVHGTTTGTLTLARRGRRRFRDRDVQLVQAAADQVALALDNARLYSETRRQLDDLRRAEAQLIQSDRLSAIGRLAAAAAHEVRNPLTAILGQAQLLLTQPDLSGGARERVNLVIGETSRAVQILQDLLMFSQQHPPQRRPCALGDQVGRVLELARYDLQHAGVAVETDLVPCPPIWADENQLQQVLLNLVQNAQQAMARHSGERRLTLRVRPTESGATIEVLDTGPGIPPEILGRIFDPFFTTKPAGEGTGLGLWVAYSIIEQHGGRLRAENRPEGGAAFVVELRNRRPA